MKFTTSCLFSIWGLLGWFVLGGGAAEAAGNAPLSPPPRIVEHLGGSFHLPPTVNLRVSDKADTAAVAALREFLAKRGIMVGTGDDAAAMIFLGVAGEPSAAPLEGKLDSRRLPLRPEGYLLRIEQRDDQPGVILLEGNDSRGLFYGVQTLKQLLDGETVENLRIEDYPALAARGVIEGFYGTPWTHVQRLEQLRFYGEQKLNTYIYAPKDDPYHRAKWRESYPAAEMARLQELIAAARANEVDFVFAISPGIDIAFDGAAGQRDFAALAAKLESVYAMGVRSFAVYFDDIEDKSAVKQAMLLNRLQKEFVERKADVKPLLTVPTEYFTQDMIAENGALKPYTQEFSGQLDPKVRVMYTGSGVVVDGITESDALFATRVYGRKMAIWWNYPTTDYFTNKLALGPIVGLNRNLAGYTDYFAMNPMEHAELSKITLQTGAEYAWNPHSYQPEAAWRRAIMMQYGDLAPAMQVFADHSARLDMDWAKAGRSDAPALRAQMDALWSKLRRQENGAAEIAALHAAFRQMIAAQRQLQAKLPPEILAECSQQLALFGKLARYDVTALQMVEAQLRGDAAAYQRLRQATEANRKSVRETWAKISEHTAAAFLDEALAFTQK